MERTDRRAETGSALLVAVMMLVMMGLIGFAALETVMRDQQVAGFQNRAGIAFYAADAGVWTAQNLIRNAVDRSERPPMANTALSDAAAFPYGRPSYVGVTLAAADTDCSIPSPICWFADGPPPEGGNLRIGTRQFVNSLWEVHVQGISGDNTTWIDSVQTRVLDRGYSAN